MRRDALRPFATGGKLDFTKDVIARTGGVRRPVLAHRSSEYIKDMGTPARLQQVEADWQAGRISLASRRRPAVFLDRDGTLNVEKGHLADAGASGTPAARAEALRALRQAGFRIVVVTNQPVIARGEATRPTSRPSTAGWNGTWAATAPISMGSTVCPHHPDAGFPGERPELKIACDCRKPATALVDRACEDLHLDPPARGWSATRSRDLELARRAGLRSFWCAPAPAGGDGHFPANADFTVDDLAAAARLILGEQAVAAVIISRTPLRVSLLRRRLRPAGLLPPSRRRGALDRHRPVRLCHRHRKFDDAVRVSYSRTEEVAHARDVEHPLVREALAHAGHRRRDRDHLGGRHPSAGHGAGLVQRLHRGPAQRAARLFRAPRHAADLARESCQIEIDRCEEPIGKQDQYAAAFGGFNFIRFNPDETVEVKKVVCPPALLMPTSSRG